MIHKVTNFLENREIVICKYKRTSQMAHQTEAYLPFL